MRVLSVCREIPLNSKLHDHSIAEFIFEQNKGLEKLGVDYQYFLVKESGLRGYLKSAKNFHIFLKENNYNYDLIHAHGGHIGSVANTQRRIPVITTYHGSDINILFNRLVSFFSIISSAANIFVSKKMFNKVQNLTHDIIIPCGVDFKIFKPLDKTASRIELGLDSNKSYILFAGRQERAEKNFKLAKEAAGIAGVNELLELKDYTRREVNLLLNACDLLLLTSVAEGSPQVIKEAMACNCPIVSTDVGDVSEIISETEGCFVTSFDPLDVAEKINQSMQFNRRTDGRNAIMNLDNDKIAYQILELYKKIIKKQKR